MHLDLRLTAHRPEDEARAAALQCHRRCQRMDRFRARPVLVRLEVGAAVLEEHAGARDGDAGAERLIEALVEADRHAITVHRAEVDRVAVAACRAECPDQPVVPLRVVRREAVERFEAVERLEGEVAAAVRRHLADVEVAPPRADGLDPLRLLPGEVLRCERRRRAAAHAAVEVADVLDRVGQVGLDQGVVRQEDALALGVAFEERARHLGDLRQPRRAAHAPASVVNGRLRELAEVAGAEALVQGEQAGDAAGHGDGADAPLRHLLLDLCLGGQAAGGVEPVEPVPGPDHGDQVAAEAAHVRVDDGEHEVHRDRGVGSVAAGGKDGQTGGRGEVVRRGDSGAGEGRGGHAPIVGTRGREGKRGLYGVVLPVDDAAPLDREARRLIYGRGGRIADCGRR